MFYFFWKILIYCSCHLRIVYQPENLLLRLVYQGYWYWLIYVVSIWSILLSVVKIMLILFEFARAGFYNLAGGLGERTYFNLEGKVEYEYSYWMSSKRPYLVLWLPGSPKCFLFNCSEVTSTCSYSRAVRFLLILMWTSLKPLVGYLLICSMF